MGDDNVIEIDGRKVGYGYSPVISAELSINHSGNLETALQMIDSAAENGTDGVKLQYYKAEDFSQPDGEMITYKEISPKPLDRDFDWITESVYSLFKRNEISLDFVKACQERVKEHELIFGVTTTSVEGVKEMAELEIDYFKVSSDMVDNNKMIHEMRKYDIPVIISTGHMPEGTITPALNLVLNTLWLHCVSAYPAEHAKLWRLKHMVEQLRDVGYSHHSQGIDACIRATEIGAKWLEFHFVLDKAQPGPDSFWSLDPTELKQLSEAIK